VGGFINLHKFSLNGNTAPLGGGIFSTSSAEVVMRNTTVRGNVAGDEGAGLHVEHSTLTVVVGRCRLALSNPRSKRLELSG
jgi:hypothetical protein